MLVCFGWIDEEDKNSSSTFLEEEAICGGNIEGGGDIEVERRRKKGDVHLT